MIEPYTGADVFVFQLRPNTKNPDLTFSLKVPAGTRELYMAISSSPYVYEPTKESSYWYDTTIASLNINIAVNKTDKNYCTGCVYHIAVGPINLTPVEAKYEVKVGCPEGQCTK